MYIDQIHTLPSFMPLPLSAGPPFLAIGLLLPSCLLDFFLNLDYEQERK